MSSWWGALTVSLAGGACLSLLVAWAAVLVVMQFPALTSWLELWEGRGLYEGVAGAGERWHAEFVETDAASFGYAHFSSAHRAPRLASSNQAARRSVTALPSWSVGRTTPSGGESQDVLMFEVASGWPWIAWMGRYATTFPDHYANLPAKGIGWSTLHPLPAGSGSWCIPVAVAPFELSMSANLLVLLPLRPVFPNAIWSVGSYAAPFYLLYLIAAASRQRRERRLRRGRCPRCNYDVSGLDSCSECGEQIKQPPCSGSARTSA